MGAMTVSRVCDGKLTGQNANKLSSPAPRRKICLGIFH